MEIKKLQKQIDENVEMMDKSAKKFINGADWGENPLPYFISVLICGGTALVYYHGKVVGKKSN